jgi:hypothetical protein
MGNESAWNQWNRPDSTSGLVSELAWLVASVAVFSVIAVVEPFDLSFEPALPLAAVWVGIGAGLGVAVVASVLLSNSYRAFTEDKPRQFLVMFAVAMAVQLGLLFVPTETLLVLLAASVAAIPTRIALYVRSGQ